MEFNENCEFKNDAVTLIRASISALIWQREREREEGSEEIEKICELPFAIRAVEKRVCAVFLGLLIEIYVKYIVSAQSSLSVGIFLVCYSFL